MEGKRTEENYATVTQVLCTLMHNEFSMAASKTKYAARAD